MLIDVLYVVLGIVLLSGGGEALIRATLSLSKRLGVSPLLTGLVVVGFGTSAPELFVSVDAGLRGQADLAIGNVVGSNIGNILLILGVCALITPLSVKPSALRRDALVVLASSVLFSLFIVGGSISSFEAMILLAALFAYLCCAYYAERGARPEQEPLVYEEEAAELTRVPQHWVVMLLMLLAGLLLLIGGSYVLLKGAVALASDLGVSEALIGLTIVAIGTSLPELSISIIASIRRHTDVAIGNVLGSNIFNTLGILGVSALLQPLSITGRIFHFDQWVMFGASVLLFLFMLSGRTLSRLEGFCLLSAYLVYVALSVCCF